uniref:Torsin-1B n=1 Tax=Globodera pallida TaxID=36090 RepID=A0A183CH84_GLOPA
MSFHGWTGSGKNYLAKMIAKAIYKKAMRSQFVHQYVATHHFPNVEETDKYKEQLRTWIRANLSNCERSLFIFDEMDKMPIQLLDAIVPFLDFYDHLNGIDSLMEEIIQISAYNEGEGGLKSSRLINKHLIDYFVPFLPLERKHVVMCFKDYLRSLNVNYTPEQLERLVDSISYFPRETPIYASAGCKQVVQRTDFMLDDLIRESRLAINNYSDEL